METIIELIVNNGLSVVLVGYFIFKDYKFNGQIVNLLTETKEILAVLNSYHRKGEE